MGVETMQGGMLGLLGVLTLIAAVSLVMLAAALRAIRTRQEQIHRLLESKDVGPALHGIVQQAREINRVLGTIDKRLEKLEALEKVQIAHFAMREENSRAAQR